MSNAELKEVKSELEEASERVMAARYALDTLGKRLTQSSLWNAQLFIENARYNLRIADKKLREWDDER